MWPRHPPAAASAGRGIRRPGYPQAGVSAGRGIRRPGYPPAGVSAGRGIRRPGYPPAGVSAGRGIRRPGYPPAGAYPVDDLVQAGPPGDLLPGLALPVPLMLVLELLGVPQQDSPQLCAWTDTAFSMTRHSQEEIKAARGHLEEYVAGMIGERRERPGDDLLGALVAERDEGGRLTEKELIGFAFLLLTAGYLSTVNAISSGILTLLLHSAELDRLRARPELVPTAVEELPRYNPSAISGALPRVALEDVDLGGVTVRAGEAVVPAIGSANHDASVFHAPERVDVAREANSHLAFGYGVHRCLGAQMARMELQVAVATLLRRLPTIRLAVPEHELRWKDHPVSRGLLSLPVTW